MSDDEILDVVDDSGRLVGVADRRSVHADGLWHRVVHLLVVADHAGVPTVVLQERSNDKATFPGLLDISTAGHLLAGESPHDGFREVREELGVDLDPASLVPLGVRRVVDAGPDGVNRELCHVFLARDDRPLADYRPDPREVSGVADLPIEAGLDLVAGLSDEVLCLVHSVDAGGAHTRPVRRQDLVPEPDTADMEGGMAYWIVLLVMAGRLASGDRRLAI